LLCVFNKSICIHIQIFAKKFPPVNELESKEFSPIPLYKIQWKIFGSTIILRISDVEPKTSKGRDYFLLQHETREMTEVFVSPSSSRYI
jgi:hypothetical protein